MSLFMAFMFIGSKIAFLGQKSAHDEPIFGHF
jgi:hypothetical protein